jgi:hypothetical protein
MPIGGLGRTALHGLNNVIGQNGPSLLTVTMKTTTQTFDAANSSRVVTSSWRCLVTTRAGPVGWRRKANGGWRRA